MSFRERIKLELPLGEGELGTIWLAREGETRRVVAILEPDAPRIEFERFESRARALAGVQHPAIVRCRDHGRTEEGSPYVVMDYIEGESLAQRWASAPPLRASHWIELVASLAEGLATVHAAGVSHGDIEPGNVLLTGEEGHEKAHLIGLFLSRAHLRADPPAGVASHATAFAYAAPEQLRGTSDAASDLFGLGALAWAGLAGVAPHVASDAQALVDAVAQGTIAPLGKVRPEFAPFAAVLEKATHDEPAKRHANAAAFAKALRAALTLSKPAGAKELAVHDRVAFRPPSRPSTSAGVLATVAASRPSVGAPAASTKSGSLPAKASVPAASGPSRGLGARPASRAPLGGLPTRASLPPKSSAPAKTATTPPTTAEKTPTAKPPLGQPSPSVSPVAPSAKSAFPSAPKPKARRADGTEPVELDDVTIAPSPPPPPETLASGEVEVVGSSQAAPPSPPKAPPKPSRPAPPQLHTPPPSDAAPSDVPSSVGTASPPPSLATATLDARAVDTPAVGAANGPASTGGLDLLEEELRGGSGPPRWLLGALGVLAAALLVAFVGSQWLRDPSPPAPRSRPETIVAPPAAPVVVAPPPPAPPPAPVVATPAPTEPQPPATDPAPSLSLERPVEPPAVRRPRPPRDRTRSHRSGGRLPTTTRSTVIRNPGF